MLHASQSSTIKPRIVTYGGNQNFWGTVVAATAILLLFGTCTVGRGINGSTMASPAPSAKANPAATSGQGSLKVKTPPVPYRGDFILSGDMAQGGLLRGQVPTGTTGLLLDGEKISFTPDGFFIIGIDRDAPISSKLEAWRERGDPVFKNLSFAMGQWRIQNVNVAFNGSASPKEYDNKRPAEIAEMAASRQIKVDSDGWRQQFIWPLTGRISGVFGSQRIYRGTAGNYHNGVDVARPIGTPIIAPADGVVVLAANRPFTLEGYLLIINHGMGLSSTFLHNNALAVKQGDVVKQGQLISWVGTTGRSTGPHMHWGMRWNDKRVDPQRVAGPMPVVAQTQDAPKLIKPAEKAK